MKVKIANYQQLFLYVADRLFQSRYLIIVLFLFIRYVSYSTLGVWSEDFWEHCAAIRELMTHPWHPRHPQIAVEASHTFFTPYTLLVSLLANTFHLDPVNALAFCGGFNLLLLSYGLFKYTNDPDSQQNSVIATYTIILSLFLWGSHPWLFSGFYNIDIFNEILPYPSTFALGVTLLTLSFHRTRLNSMTIGVLLALSIICSCLLITHSLTAIFLLLGLTCQSVCKQNFQLISIFQVLVTLSLSVVFALLWPYFSILELITAAGDAYHFANSVMYLDVISRIWPTLLLIPLIIWQASQLRNRAHALMLIGLIGIYIYGYFSTKYSYGRTISYILLISNILLAQLIVIIERKITISHMSYLFKWSWLGIFLITTIIWINKSASHLLTLLNSLYLGRPLSSQISYGHLQFLKKYINQYDVVLADIESSWIIPSMTGKVVGTDHPLAFVPDWYIRKWELIQFFSTEHDDVYRKNIIDRYNPDFLLIKKSLGAIAKKISQELTDKDVYELVYEDKNFLLIKIKQKSSIN